VASVTHGVIQITVQASPSVMEPVSELNSPRDSAPRCGSNGKDIEFGPARGQPHHGLAMARETTSDKRGFMRWYLKFGACLLLANLCIAASSLAQEESAPGDRPAWQQAPESDEAKASEGLEAQIEKQDQESKLSEQAVEREKESPDFEVIDSDVQPMNVEFIDPDEPALSTREPD
jgi:hypothetical protein